MTTGDGVAMDAAAPSAGSSSCSPPGESATQRPEKEVVHHELCAFAAEDGPADATKHALVVLNSACFGRDLLKALWAKCGVRVCADGGANRLYDLASGALVPDAVVGDLDSARPDVRASFAARGAAVERVEDQDRNDLDKAIEAVRDRFEQTSRVYEEEEEEDKAEDRVVSVLGAFGGRFDHVMASLDAVIRWSSSPGPSSSSSGGRATIPHRLHFRLYSDDNLACLLVPGVDHTIRVRPDLEGPHCGLIPIGRRVDAVTTSGFKWNLQNAPLEFGHLVSTSNLFDVVNHEDDDDANGDATTNGPSTSEENLKRRNKTHLLRVQTSHPLLYTSALQTTALAAILHDRDVGHDEDDGGVPP